MQRIAPHLWFDKQAREAAEFYAFVFPDSKVTNVTALHDTPSGDCDLVSFELAGQPFMAISAGPLFRINPSVSFIVNFDSASDKNAREKLDALWEKFSEGSSVLMPLQQYPFSERYGWIQDKYGLSWQLILSNPEGEKRPFIIPCLMFAGTVCGKAEEATNFYMSVFNNARRGLIVRYDKAKVPDNESTVMFTDFQIHNQWFAAMDSAQLHDFSFSEAVSFIIPCKTQKEIDYFWEKLSAVPDAEHCGWIKDRYGLSWQVWPTVIGEMMKNGTREQINRITQAFLLMKKFDIAKLKKTYEGK